jgi:hypothetical protein
MPVLERFYLHVKSGVNMGVNLEKLFFKEMTILNDIFQDY